MTRWKTLVVVFFFSGRVIAGREGCPEKVAVVRGVGVVANGAPVIVNGSMYIFTGLNKMLHILYGSFVLLNGFIMATETKCLFF